MVFKRTYFCEEEREARELLQSIREKEENPIVTDKLEELAITFAQDYPKFLRVLGCIDGLYSQLVEEGYHTFGCLATKVRKFQLVDLDFPRRWVEDSDIGNLIKKLNGCKKGFDLTDFDLEGNGNSEDKIKIGRVLDITQGPHCESELMFKQFERYDAESTERDLYVRIVALNDEG